MDMQRRGDEDSSYTMENGEQRRGMFNVAFRMESRAFPFFARSLNDGQTPDLSSGRRT
jgi:hypothetical protein